MGPGEAYQLLPPGTQDVQLVADQTAPSGARYTTGFVMQPGDLSLAEFESRYTGVVAAS